MIDSETKKEILDLISSRGSTDDKAIQINTNINDILNFSSGSARIQSTVRRKAKLILSQPSRLAILNPFQIRCALCHKVISYPCWYYDVRYAVNHFHYFICFDSNSIDKPSTRCRKG